MDDAMIFFEMLVITKSGKFRNDKIIVRKCDFINMIGRDHRANVVNRLYSPGWVISSPCGFQYFGVVNHKAVNAWFFLFFAAKNSPIDFQLV